jgi:hypothetical protein
VEHVMVSIHEPAVGVEFQVFEVHEKMKIL